MPIWKGFFVDAFLLKKIQTLMFLLPDPIRLDYQ